MTYNELCNVIYEHNRVNNIHQQFQDDNPLICVVVYSKDNWPDKHYSLESRSYKFRSDNKQFLHGMLGNSIFADSLDNLDKNIRIDKYDLKIEDCYILNYKGEIYEN